MKKQFKKGDKVTSPHLIGELTYLAGGVLNGLPWVVLTDGKDVRLIKMKLIIDSLC